jgi:tetratricopeptide (TPR) repeat protein
MSAMNQHWETVSPYLDQALALSDEDRAAWLAELNGENSDLANLLHSFLNEYRVLSQEGFLEKNRPPLSFSVPLAGTSIGTYRLVLLIGQGGMGSVWLAERSDGEIEQKAAIKLLRADADQPSFRDRFLQERQLLANLNHPAIARLLDAGHTSGGQPYLVMEYIEGAPIDVYAAQLPVRERLALFLRVCDGISHAHGRLIIHRDLKPSNILVDAAGQPKILDFGIAKLLDNGVELTQTIERILTPGYASPEQFRGTTQTTATDIYSLGALLYKMLTGQPPHVSASGELQAIEIVAGTREIAAPRRLNPSLPSDLDFILLKALRREPEQRYASVEAFARDIGAFLEARPVLARSADAWYRTRKFLRRYWVQVTAAAVVVASLSAGLYVANRERVMAEQRFTQLRQLSNKVFELDSRIKVLPGSIPARRDLVAASLEYLRGLQFDTRKDLDLAQEVAEGYLRIGRIQGVPTEMNFGEAAQADVSLKKAAELTDLVLAARPQDHAALFRSADIAHDRMILAEGEHRRADALAYARKAAEGFDRFLRRGDAAPGEINLIPKRYINIGLAYSNMQIYPEAIESAQRASKLARSIPSAEPLVSASLSVMANALRFQGDLEGALRAIHEAREFEDRAVYPDTTTRTFDRYGLLLREGMILAEDGGINLSRPADAIIPLREALDLTEQMAQQDPNDYSSRSRVGTSARELGNILRHRDPGQALGVYDLGIRRLREIRNNLKARRDLAELLAGSSHALRRLNRMREAGERIDESLTILTSTKDYPTAQIQLGESLSLVLKARADDEAARGDPQRAAALYEELLQKIMAAKPEPLTDLRDAARLSQFYETLAVFYDQVGEKTKAESIERQRLDLWRSWDRKLPNNPFILRQIRLQPVSR